VNALLIGLKTIILTALKSSLAHALNRETLPLSLTFGAAVVINITSYIVCNHFLLRWFTMLLCGSAMRKYETTFGTIVHFFENDYQIKI